MVYATEPAPWWTLSSRRSTSPFGDAGVSWGSSTPSPTSGALLGSFVVGEGPVQRPRRARVSCMHRRGRPRARPAGLPAVAARAVAPGSARQLKTVFGTLTPELDTRAILVRCTRKVTRTRAALIAAPVASRPLWIWARVEGRPSPTRYADFCPSTSSASSASASTGSSSGVKSRRRKASVTRALRVPSPVLTSQEACSTSRVPMTAWHNASV
jgi:hypothetical protein